jgi:hypothetical protein
MKQNNLLYTYYKESKNIFSDPSNPTGFVLLVLITFIVVTACGIIANHYAAIDRNEAAVTLQKFDAQLTCDKHGYAYYKTMSQTSHGFYTTSYTPVLMNSVTGLKIMTCDEIEE